MNKLVRIRRWTEKKKIVLLKLSLLSKDANLRIAAIKALGNLGNTGAVNALIKRLSDDSVEVIENAAEALGKLGDEKAIKPLESKYYHHENFLVRFAAAEALINISDKYGAFKKTYLLEQLLEEGLSKDSEEQIIKLGKQVVEPLKEILNSKIYSDNIRKNAAIMLIMIAKRRQGLLEVVDKETVINCFKPHRDFFSGHEDNGVSKHRNYTYPGISATPSSSDCSHRDISSHEDTGPGINYDDDIYRLANFTDTKIVNSLLQLMRMNIAVSKKAAQMFLHGLDGKYSIEPLMYLLVFDSPVREFAAKELERIGEVQWISVIRGDDDDFIRLVKSGDERIIEIINLMNKELGSPVIAKALLE